MSVRSSERLGGENSSGRGQSRGERVPEKEVTGGGTSSSEKSKRGGNHSASTKWIKEGDWEVTKWEKKQKKPTRKKEVRRERREERDARTGKKKCAGKGKKGMQHKL